jgi:hypothetical protein
MSDAAKLQGVKVSAALIASFKLVCFQLCNNDLDLSDPFELPLTITDQSGSRVQA